MNTQARQILYAILSKYISQESIDEVWQEVKEAGIFSGHIGASKQPDTPEADSSLTDPSDTGFPT